MTAAILHALIIGTTSVCGLMLVLWLIHLPLRNAAIVEAGWAGGLALLGAIYAATAGGYPVRSLLIAAMAALWGLRLGIFLLFTRVIGHREEGRYVQLRREWGGNLPLKFLLFFQFQALLCVLLSVTFLVAAFNPRPRLLDLTCRRARLEDGQDVLELGCGWGSLSLYMAGHYLNSRILAVSNSRSQKQFIDAEAARRGLTNLEVATADITNSTPRAVSIAWSRWKCSNICATTRSCCGVSLRGRARMPCCSYTYLRTAASPTPSKCVAPPTGWRSTSSPAA